MILGNVISMGYFSNQDNLFDSVINTPPPKKDNKQPSLPNAKPKKPAIDIEALFQRRLQKQLED